MLSGLPFNAALIPVKATARHSYAPALGNCSRRLCFAALAGFAAFGSSAASAQTSPRSVAASTVTNVAAIDLLLNGIPAHISSDVATFRIDELLDLRLTGGADGAAVSGAALAATPFLLTNGGNGNEAFVLDLRVEGLAATLEGFALDRDADGLFDPAIDLRIASGAATPSLAPGEAAPLLALLRGDGSSAIGTLIVSARAVTGSGTPGTTFDGRGDDGTDAVVGATTAAAELRFPLALRPGADAADVSVSKSQSVLAPDGGATPVRGATITYTLEARFTGSGLLASARIADPVPTGTAYVPGSLRLDDRSLTDAADSDPGVFDSQAITVTLGDVAAPAIRTVQFKVIIQ